MIGAPARSPQWILLTTLILTIFGLGWTVWSIYTVNFRDAVGLNNWVLAGEAPAVEVDLQLVGARHGDERPHDRHEQDGQPNRGNPLEPGHRGAGISRAPGTGVNRAESRLFQ